MEAGEGNGVPYDYAARLTHTTTTSILILLLHGKRQKSPMPDHQCPCSAIWLSAGAELWSWCLFERKNGGVVLLVPFVTRSGERRWETMGPTRPHSCAIDGKEKEKKI